jgi:stress response protein SCP2
MTMQTLVAGQNISLPYPLLRVGSLLNKSASEHSELIAFLIPRDHSKKHAEAIFNKNRHSSRGEVVLYGIERHWSYEIELSSLFINYRKLVFIIKPKASFGKTDLLVTLNIENIAVFHLMTQLKSSSALRIGEIYFHNADYKFKAFNDYFSDYGFSENYTLNSNIKEIINNSKQIATRLPEKTPSFLERFIEFTPITFKVAVIGSKDVGKTSLLAAMHNQLCRIQAISGINFDSYDSGFTLDRFLKSMLDVHFSGDLTQNNHKHNSSVTQGYQITVVEGNFSFAMNLDFIESSTGIDDASCFNRNVELIRSSDMVIFVLDAPALIEKNGCWNESVNRSGELKDLCKHALAETSRNKLIILAPIKCESYMRDHIGCHRLLCVVEEHCVGLLNFLEKIPEIALAVTPVQTLGNIHLADSTINDNALIFNFKSNRIASTYSPRDADQVMTYLLSFAFSQYLLSKRKAPPNDLKYIQTVLNKLLKHRKQGAEGFKIFQGFYMLG